MHYLVFTIMYSAVLLSCPLKSLGKQATSASIPVTDTPGLHFKVKLQNTQNATSNNSTQVSTKHVRSKAGEKPLLQQISKLVPELSEADKEKISNFLYPQTYLKRHKWFVLGGLAASMYGLLCYYTYRGNSYLGSNDLWSSWHQELPFDQLLSIPQEQIAKELLHEIQRRYSTPGSITDLIQPLSLFMVTIGQEEETIKWYQWFYSWLAYSRITKIIPFSKQQFAQTKERLQRIAYFKNIFQTWAAQYQLEHSARCVLDVLRENYPDVTPIAQEIDALVANQMEQLWDEEE